MIIKPNGTLKLHNQYQSLYRTTESLFFFSSIKLHLFWITPSLSQIKTPQRWETLNADSLHLLLKPRRNSVQHICCICRYRDHMRLLTVAYHSLWWNLVRGWDSLIIRSRQMRQHLTLQMPQLKYKRRFRFIFYTRVTKLINSIFHESRNHTHA